MILRWPCCTVATCHSPYIYSKLLLLRRWPVRWTCVFRVGSCQAANHWTFVPGLNNLLKIACGRDINVNDDNDDNEFDNARWALPLQCSSLWAFCQYGLLCSPSARSASWPMCFFNCPSSETLMSHPWSSTGCHSSAARFHMASTRSSSSLPAAKSTETCLLLSCWARKPRYAWEPKAMSSS